MEYVWVCRKCLEKQGKDPDKVVESCVGRRSGTYTCAACGAAGTGTDFKHVKLRLLPNLKEKPPLYYVLHPSSNDCALWWRPNKTGYTFELTEAGLYRCEDVTESNAFLIPKNVAEDLAVTHVRLSSLQQWLGVRKVQVL